MANLIYVANMSLDGYTEDRTVSLTGQTQVGKCSDLLPTSYGQRVLISMDGECMRP